MKIIAILLIISSQMANAESKHEKQIAEIKAALLAGGSLWSSGAPIGNLPPNLHPFVNVRFVESGYEVIVDSGIDESCKHGFQVFIAESKCNVKSASCFWAFTQQEACVAF